MAKRNLYEEITNLMIESIESGVPAWMRPWVDGKAVAGVPHNGDSGRPYSGINQLILWCNQYSDMRYLTFNQIRNLGGNVKGQKATTVTFWDRFKTEDKNGNEKFIPYVKAFHVFNIEQITGLDESKLYSAPAAPDQAVTTGTELANTVGAKLLPYGGNRAYYVPSQDAIRLPALEQFKGENCFDAVIYHELVHWTGHTSRKNRDLSGRFGDMDYAAEELIAEMGSAFICARLGVEMKGLQHASYVDHWLKILRGDNRAIFTAARHAREAVEFMLDTVPEEQQQAA